MKNQKNIKLLIIIIITLLIFIINLILLINKVILPQKKLNADNEYFQKLLEQKYTSKEEKNNNDSNNTDLSKIKSKSEYERMQIYFSQYINYIENKQYEEAYAVLYPEFKQQYFPEISKFIEYVKKTYPNFVAFEYESFSRQGEVYIMTVKIIDPVHGKKDDEVKQRIILKENDFYDYVLSFQVI